ncbi:MAG: hypothetical protein ACK4PI_00905 [Tepidisphaerales bacterium]
MNRPARDNPIDRHLQVVRRRELLSAALHHIGVSLAVAAGVAVVGLLAGRLLAWHVPLPSAGLAVLVAAAVGFAVIRAWLRAPTLLDVAVRIDRRLGLHERLSTAVLLRETDGPAPFAAAAVADAERVAAGVDVRPHFPVRWPRTLYLAAAAAGVWLALWATVPQRDLLGHQAAAERRQQHAERAEQARQQVTRALELIDRQLPLVSGSADIARAKAELERLLERPISDPAAAQRSALAALQELENALQDRIRTSQNFAAAERDRRLLRQLASDPGEQGWVAEAKRAVAQGDFDRALQSLEQLTEAFENLSRDEQQQLAEQMRQLARQLEQLAQTADGREQLARQMQQALQQQGLSESGARQLAQQVARAMQEAAGGTSAEQQQLLQDLQHLAEEALQQAGGSLSPQQRQALEQMLQQAMQQAQGQSTAQQLAQAAAAMAQAMQQAGAASSQGAPSSPQAGKASSGEPSGSGQSSGGQGPASMQQALEQMRQQLRAMQAMQDDARAMASAAATARDAAAQAAAGGNAGGTGNAGDAATAPGGAQSPGGGHLPGGGTSPGATAGGWGSGGGAGNNARGGGQGAGDRSFKEVAPFAVRPDRAPTQTDERGRVLASSFVRAGAIKGEATEELKDVVRSNEQQAAEEVDTERVGRAAQRTVRQYFNSLTGP